MGLGPEDVTSQYNYAVALLFDNKPEEVIAQLHAVLQMRPDLPDAHFHFGGTLLLKGRRQEAATSLAEAGTADAGERSAHNALGVALAQVQPVRASPRRAADCPSPGTQGIRYSTRI
jgi:hypothetical protein